MNKDNSFKMTIGESSDKVPRPSNNTNKTKDGYIIGEVSKEEYKAYQAMHLINAEMASSSKKGSMDGLLILGTSCGGKERAVEEILNSPVVLSDEELGLKRGSHLVTDVTVNRMKHVHRSYTLKDIVQGGRKR